MIKANVYYQHAHMRGVYILVKAITKSDKDKIYIKVDWYRKDDKTKKLIDMETPQDMVIPVEDLKFWIVVSK